eukprot:scaffold25405_cov33-Tisochrysis_lutea.AAC.5
MPPQLKPTPTPARPPQSRAAGASPQPKQRRGDIRSQQMRWHEPTPYARCRHSFGCRPRPRGDEGRIRPTCAEPIGVRSAPHSQPLQRQQASREAQWPPRAPHAPLSPHAAGRAVLFEALWLAR